MIAPQIELLDFMKDMNAWELRCAARTKECLTGQLTFDQATNAGEAEYAQIFAKYCSSKSKGRDFHYTEPPDYDPQREHVISVTRVSPDLIELKTHQDHSHRKEHVFRLVLEDGKWRILDKMVLLPNGDTLEASI